MPWLRDRGMITYRISADQELVLTDEVVALMVSLRQEKPRDREAGGQLFGTTSATHVTISHATGPRPGDLRGRGLFLPNRSAERREIRAHHRLGRTYLGDWHTHPEPKACPSPRDLASAAETARKSRYLAGPFVLIVVGTAAPPLCLHVMLHDGQDAMVLSLSSSSG